jgi:glycerophosphoryl diester phosphodiesterase
MGWPYPRIIAHRGAGTLAPENTIAALSVGYQRGFRAVEFDVMLSRDSVPVLMHDPEFGRTVRGTGRVADALATDLVGLDAGSWFDARYTGETIPLYSDVLRYCDGHGIFMNVEIKPSPGDEERTGEVVAAMTREHYANAGTVALRPLFSSFSAVALAAAQRVAPDIARGHLFDRIPTDWQDRLRALDCVALHCNQRYLGREMAEAIVGASFGLFCYTVNDVVRAAELLGWGVDAFCTDRLDLIDADFALKFSAQHR